MAEQGVVLNLSAPGNNDESWRVLADKMTSMGMLLAPVVPAACVSDSQQQRHKIRRAGHSTIRQGSSSIEGRHLVKNTAPPAHIQNGDESGEQGRGFGPEGIVSPALSWTKESSKCHLPLRVGFGGLTCCVSPLTTLLVIYCR